MAIRFLQYTLVSSGEDKSEHTWQLLGKSRWHKFLLSSLDDLYFVFLHILIIVLLGLVLLGWETQKAHWRSLLPSELCKRYRFS